MAKLFGREIRREELERYVGDLSQVAGFQPVELDDGPGRGVRAINVWNGSGLEFTVVPDRGMDISQCRYRGVPLAWCSPVGEAHPHAYDPAGLGWLKTFYGGLVVTCGLTQVGAPSSDEGEELGLHGRFSHLPAQEVRWDWDWQGEELYLRVRGKVREWRMFGPNLVLSRTISTHLGDAWIRIEDRVVNQGTKTSPLMLLYHVNLGWPVVAPGAEVLSSCSQVRPRDPEAAKGEAHWNRIHEPVRAFREQVFYLEHRPDADGYVDVALVNREFPGGQLGVALRFPKQELPKFTLWKQLDEKEYVVGLEPANCWVEGRAKERQRRALEFIEPGQERRFSLEIRVITGDAIDGLQRALQARG